MAMNVKAYLEKNGDRKAEIRRFQVPSGSSDLYGRLRTKIAQTFKLPEEGFRLFWQDSDEDFIVFSSTLELMEAVRQSQDDVARIFVKPVEEKPEPQPAQGASGGKKPSAEKKDGEKVFHPGVVCDGCDNNIYGPRYKCVICPDYDLCATCEQKGIHPEHDKFKITHPQTAGGPGGFMPPHFRRWMHRFFKRNQGQCPAGGASSGPAEGKPSCGPCGGGRNPNREGSSFGSAEDEYLEDVGENIRAFLSNMGIDVSYEVRHNDQKQGGSFSTNLGGGRPCGGGAGPWQFFMPGFASGSSSFSTSSTSSTSTSTTTSSEKPTQTPAEEPAKNSSEKAAEEPVVEEMHSEADAQEIPITMEEETIEPTIKEASKEASPSRSSEEDWTMLNEEPCTDGEQSSGQPQANQASGSAPREGIYPSLKVAKAVEIMKAMGFNDDGGWLTRLLENTDGDIAVALDTLKLGAAQAGRLS